MPGNSRWCNILKLVIYTLVVLFATVFLSIATYETLKYGPDAGGITIKLISITFNKLYVSPSKKLVAFWNADMVFVNHKSNLNLTIPPFGAFLTYDGIPFSCGRVNHTLRIGTSQQKAFTIHGVVTGCEWGKVFMAGAFATNLTMDIEHKWVPNMGLEMSINAYYRHAIWGWDALIKPYCDDLILELQDARGQGRLHPGQGRNKSCQIPPLSYH